MSDQDSNDTTALGLSRRTFLAAASGVGGLAFAGAAPVRAAIVNTDFRGLPPYGNRMEFFFDAAEISGIR